jgi:hypothetical protein
MPGIGRDLGAAPSAWTVAGSNPAGVHIDLNVALIHHPLT